MVEPQYYSKNGLSPIKAFEQGLLSEDEYIGFLKGNIIKYTIRAGEKTEDSLMDIIKAIDYLHYLHQALKIKKEKKRENNSLSIDISDSFDDKLDEVKKSIESFKKEYL